MRITLTLTDADIKPRQGPSKDGPRTPDSNPEIPWRSAFPRLSFLSDYVLFRIPRLCNPERPGKCSSLLDRSVKVWERSDDASRGNRRPGYGELASPLWVYHIRAGKTDKKCKSYNEMGKKDRTCIVEGRRVFGPSSGLGDPFPRNPGQVRSSRRADRR